MTWKERRRIRAVHANLKRLSEYYIPRIDKLHKGATHDSLLNEWIEQRSMIKSELWKIRSDDTIRKSERWNLRIPPRSAEHWEQDIIGTYYLRPEAIRLLRIGIVEARQKQIRWWHEILVPVLALAVALSAILASQCARKPDNPLVVLPNSAGRK